MSASANTPRSLFTFGAQPVSSAPLAGSTAAMWWRTVHVPLTQTFTKWPPRMSSPSDIVIAWMLPSVVSRKPNPPVGVHACSRLPKLPVKIVPSAACAIETIPELEVLTYPLASAPVDGSKAAVAARALVDVPAFRKKPPATTLPALFTSSASTRPSTNGFHERSVPSVSDTAPRKGRGEPSTFWNCPPMKSVEPLVANACTSPSAVAVNVVLEMRLPLLSSSAMCGRPTPSILLKLPPMMMCPAPSVAIVLTVLLAAGVHALTRLPWALKAARFDTAAVVAPLWLVACVNLPPT